jgi:hypothetical protein
VDSGLLTFTSAANSFMIFDVVRKLLFLLNTGEFLDVMPTPFSIAFPLLDELGKITEYFDVPKYNQNGFT